MQTGKLFWHVAAKKSICFALLTYQYIFHTLETFLHEYLGVDRSIEKHPKLITYDQNTVYLLVISPGCIF